MNPLIPMEYLIPLAIVAGALVLYLNWRSTSGRDPAPRLGLLSLRTVVVILLLVLALNPGHWKERATEQTGAWILLLDQSPSMAVADARGETRYQRAREWLTEAERRIENTGTPVYRFAYDDDLAPIEDVWPDAPRMDSGGTALASSLERVWTRIPGSVDALGVLVAGDGREIPDADSTDAILRAREAGAPIHTYAVGGEVDVPDIEIRSRPRRVTVFDDQRPVIRGQVRATGLGPLRPEIELLDGTGNVVDRQRVTLDAAGEANFSFERPPLDPGFYEYRLRTPPHPDEIRLSNNEAPLGIVVLEGDLNVLLVEGSPHWDTKFIVQLLRESAHVRLSTVHRVTADRFFRVAAEEAGLTEESSAVFPDTLEELNEYDLVLFGKGVEYFIDEDRAALLQRFVADHGGALVFTRGKPWQGENESLEQLQPFQWGDFHTAAVRWQPTVHGESAGLFGHALPGHADSIWENTPSVGGVRRVEGLASFAQVLVEGHSPNGLSPSPILAVRRLGQGMVVALNAEGLWEWDFFPQLEEAGEFYRDFWAQLIQWTSTYNEFLPGQHYAVRLGRSTARSGESVRLFLAERDTETESSSEPSIAVIRGGEEIQRFRASPVTRGNYRWQAFLELDEAGLYRIEAHAPGADGPSGSAHLEILPPPSESDNLSADHEFLRRLARSTGGAAYRDNESFRIDDADARDPAGALADGGDATWETRWDTSWLLLLLVGMAGAEWALRRRLGLL